ncbi:MAG: DUF3089 domain-containing protein [Bacteroidales bacterium]|nr:DUF3089 domain-containing protein [Bacteroidales bacterium]
MKNKSTNAMRRMLFPCWVVLLVGLSACSLNKPKKWNETPWDAADAWYADGDSMAVGKADVFYVVSTNVARASDDRGNPLVRATLNADDRKYMDLEFAFVKRHIFRDDFNFIAPYYHQLTFETLCGHPSEAAAAYPDVAAEVCKAFDHYMAHHNNGRPFILAGFSQGGMIMVDLLKHLTEEQYSRLIATYMIGYRLTDTDLRHPHIHAAQADSDRQVVVSFNSVASKAGVWSLVAADAATCMNPVNWHTDSTPAQFVYQGDTCTVRVDTLGQVLIVTSQHKERYEQWMQDNPLYSSTNISLDNLHHWDLLFYTDQLHHNAVIRAYNH